jgi:hypothetical protein
MMKFPAFSFFFFFFFSSSFIVVIVSAGPTRQAHSHSRAAFYAGPLTLPSTTDAPIPPVTVPKVVSLSAIPEDLLEKIFVPALACTSKQFQQFATERDLSVSASLRDLGSLPTLLRLIQQGAVTKLPYVRCQVLVPKDDFYLAVMDASGQQTPDMLHALLRSDLDCKDLGYRFSVPKTKGSSIVDYLPFTDTQLWTYLTEMKQSYLWKIGFTRLEQANTILRVDPVRYGIIDAAMRLPSSLPTIKYQIQQFVKESDHDRLHAMQGPGGAIRVWGCQAAMRGRQDVLVYMRSQWPDTFDREVALLHEAAAISGQRHLSHWLREVSGALVWRRSTFNLWFLIVVLAGNHRDQFLDLLSLFPDRQRVLDDILSRVVESVGRRADLISYLVGLGANPMTGDLAISSSPLRKALELGNEYAFTSLIENLDRNLWDETLQTLSRRVPLRAHLVKAFRNRHVY